MNTKLKHLVEPHDVDVMKSALLSKEFSIIIKTIGRYRDNKAKAFITNKDLSKPSWPCQEAYDKGYVNALFDIVKIFEDNSNVS